MHRGVRAWEFESADQSACRTCDTPTRCRVIQPTSEAQKPKPSVRPMLGSRTGRGLTSSGP
jgi:hypothetical protein